MLTTHKFNSCNILGKVYPPGSIYLSYNWENIVEDKWIPFSDVKQNVWYMAYEIVYMKKSKDFNIPSTGRGIYMFIGNTYYRKYIGQPDRKTEGPRDINFGSFSDYYYKRYYDNHT